MPTSKIDIRWIFSLNESTLNSCLNPYIFVLLVFVIVVVFGIFVLIYCDVIYIFSRWEGATIGFRRPFSPISNHQSPRYKMEYFI
jgi:hypothetical protein